MKHSRLFAAFLALLLTVTLTLTPLSATGETVTQGLPPSITAQQYVLMDASTGQVLLQKNMDVSVHPASTTKLITAALALTSGILPEEMITVSNEAIDAVPRTSSHMAIDYGETLSFENLIYGTLLYSANDAANALAERIASGKTASQATTFEERIKTFADMMNGYAASAGAKNTVFTNANGLYDDVHVTTAFDMAMIMRQVLKAPGIDKIMQTVIYTVPATNKKEARDYITSGNLLIKSGKFNYPACIAGKTGYTEDSGYSFVAAAEKDGRTYIIAVFNCADGDSRFSDAIKLFDYGFNYFKEVTIDASLLPRGAKNVVDGDFKTGVATVYAQNGVKVLMHFTMNASSVTVKDNTPETITSSTVASSFTLSVPSDNGYMYDTLGTFPLTVNIAKLNTPVRISGTENKTDPAPDSTETKEPGKNNTASTVVLVILFIFLAALITITVVYLYTNISRQKKAKERRRERLTEREVLTKPRVSPQRTARPTAPASSQPIKKPATAAVRQKPHSTATAADSAAYKSRHSQTATSEAPVKAASAPRRYKADNDQEK